MLSCVVFRYPRFPLHTKPHIELFPLVPFSVLPPLQSVLMRIMRETEVCRLRASQERGRIHGVPRSADCGWAGQTTHAPSPSFRFSESPVPLEIPYPIPHLPPKNAYRMLAASRTTARALSARRSFASVVDAGGAKVAALDVGQPTSSVTLLVKAGSRFESKAGVAHALKNFAFKVRLGRRVLRGGGRGNLGGWRSTGARWQGVCAVGAPDPACARGDVAGHMASPPWFSADWYWVY